MTLTATQQHKMALHNIIHCCRLNCHTEHEVLQINSNEPAAAVLAMAVLLQCFRIKHTQ